MANERKEQGAFEYMMSYGWAVLILMVFAVIMWNFGVFNPASIAKSAGFSVLRPVAWSFAGGSLTSAKAVIAIANSGGVDLSVGINGTNWNNTMRLEKPLAPNCGFINQPVEVKGDSGKTVSVEEDPLNGVGFIGISAGEKVVVRGTIVGSNPSFPCGGLSGGDFSYVISYPYAVDRYNIQHSDSGTVSGKYQ